MLKFPNSFLDEIKNRILPSEVIRRKVALKNNGREFTGLCPFHKEKSPSFTVSDQKGFYHCFGCGAHGDIFKFTMETQGVSFFDAVKQFASQAGLAMPELTKEEVQKEAIQRSLTQIMNLAKNWFTEQLYAPAGKDARDYLRKRGLGRNAVDIFAVGFAPEDSHALKNFLNKKGVSDTEMLECGLLVQKERGNAYDKFRGRIMFPICDMRGQVIAFGGRTMSDIQPKYLNSPETALFKKGDILYNEHLAKPAAFKNNNLVITEGYMDVIALYMAGIKEVVAPLGTAITDRQLQRMWQLAKEPVMCLDGDAAGQRAMLRAANLAIKQLAPGNSLKFASMPNGLDPDDVIKTSGIDKFQEILAKARNLSEVLWHHEFVKIGIATPESRALLEKELGLLASRINDAGVAAHYRNFFREKFRDIVFGKNKHTKSQKNLNVRLTNLESIPEITAKSRTGAEILLILIIIHNPSLLNVDNILEEFSNIDFIYKKIEQLRTNILQAYQQYKPIDKINLQTHLEKCGSAPDISYLDSLDLYQHFGSNDIDKILHYWKYAICVYNLANLHEECENFAKLMTEESELKAVEIRKEIQKAESNITMMELQFADSQTSAY